MWMIQRVNIHKIVVEVIPEFHTHGGSHHHWRACVSPRKAFRRTAGDGAVVWWSPIWFDVFSHSNFPKIYFQREFAFKPVYSKKKAQSPQFTLFHHFSQQNHPFFMVHCCTLAPLFGGPCFCAPDPMRWSLGVASRCRCGWGFPAGGVL